MLQWSHVFSDMVSMILVSRLKQNKLLQWSHVFSDMVRLTGELIYEPEVPASMEPCLFRHGKGPSWPDLVAKTHSFNGAMSFQTW